MTTLTHPEQDTTRLDLLRAILANKGNDTLRLVYADYLEDAGEADRAEFIRLQCRLAALPPPHKRPSYPEEPIALTKHGDHHYSFCGYPEEGFEVGDRVDLLVQRPLRKSRMVYGFRVYKIAPYSTIQNRGELSIYVRLDKDAGPWEGTELRKREKELLSGETREMCNWFDWAGAAGRFIPGGSYPENFHRGFIRHITCSAEDWLAHERNLYWWSGAADPCLECRTDGEVSMVKRKYWTKKCPDCKDERSVQRPCPLTAQPLELLTITGRNDGLALHIPVAFGAVSKRTVHPIYAEYEFERWPGLRVRFAAPTGRFL